MVATQSSEHIIAPFVYYVILFIHNLHFRSHDCFYAVRSSKFKCLSTAYVRASIYFIELESRTRDLQTSTILSVMASVATTRSGSCHDTSSALVGGASSSPPSLTDQLDEVQLLEAMVGREGEFEWRQDENGRISGRLQVFLHLDQELAVRVARRERYRH